jgi:glycosyltransferase involved in cell wall biosynthesis
MKILVCNGALRVGGRESVSVALANALAAEGLQVLFASDEGPLRASLQPRVEFLRTQNANHAFITAAHELSLYVRHHRPDVVHAQGLTVALAAAIAVKASGTGAARMLTHQSPSFRTMPRFVVAPLVRRAADHYVAISHDRQAELETFGIAAERISLIPNFVDVDDVATRVANVDRAAVRAELQVPGDAKVLVMAGRVLEAKRFDQFVRIAGRVGRAWAPTPVHALVVGDGPALADVRKVAAREAVPARVHMVGYQRDVYPYLAISDCAVFPSEHPEVLPMFLIEASAAGVPIVCSDIPGNREIVLDGATGRLVRGHVDAYANAVTGLLRDTEQAAQFVDAARRAALDHFDRTRVVRETIETYRQLVAARTPAP